MLHGVHVAWGSFVAGDPLAALGAGDAARGDGALGPRRDGEAARGHGEVAVTGPPSRAILALGAWPEGVRGGGGGGTALDGNEALRGDTGAMPLGQSKATPEGKRGAGQGKRRHSKGQQGAAARASLL